MSLNNPINVILLPPIIYILSLIFYPPLAAPTSDILPSEYDPKIYNWRPAKHPEVLLYKKYTPKELAAHDGKGGGRILLAIKRVGGGEGERTVFDVSSGRGFYGPGRLSAVLRSGLCSTSRI
jgi:membrane-associated progesterone receptor component